MMVQIVLHGTIALFVIGGEFTDKLPWSLERCIHAYIQNVYIYINGICWDIQFKPTWWDTHYSWTDATKRTALINALKTGLTLYGKTITHVPAYAQNYWSVSPVDTSGNLVAPDTVLDLMEHFTSLINPTICVWRLGSCRI